MTSKQERLSRAIIRAGVKASRKAGHVLDETELLGIKIQIAPVWLRLICGVTGIGGIVYGWFIAPPGAVSVIPIALGILFVLFSAFGVRRTTRGVLDSLDGSTSADILSDAASGIGEMVGGLFEGL